MSVQKVLIAGAGFTGLTAAIALAQRGVIATIVERRAEFAKLGHGLTIQGNALRVFQKIGVVDEVIAKGHPENALTLYFADGRVMAEMPTPPTGGPELPATLGALRPDVTEILVNKAVELGVEIRMGTSVDSFENSDDEITVTLSDGTTETWDLLVAATGIGSIARPHIGITEDRQPTGLGIYRAVTDRTPEMTGGIAYPQVDDGGAYKVGYTPISETQCYVFVLCRPERVDNGLEDWQEMQRLMANFHGPFDFLRESLNADRFLDFQQIEWIFTEKQWHKGRLVALGEAVHAVPPLIAQGAAQCVEDSLLFAEYIVGAEDVDAALTALHERRLPRVKGVVDASMLLVQAELNPGQTDIDPGRTMGMALAALIPEP